MTRLPPLLALLLLAACTTSSGDVDWPKTGGVALIAGGAGAAMLTVASPLVGGASAGVGVALAVNSDADTALAIVKPINRGLCILHPWNPKSLEAEAAIQAFCDHLPDSTFGLLTQGVAIVEAIDAAHAQQQEKTP